MAKSSFSGELLHFHATRLRVSGKGNLNLTLRSLDAMRNLTLVPLPMVGKTNREPLALSNFIEQRAQLEGGTTEIGEFFIISKIIIFVKPVATGYPQ